MVLLPLFDLFLSSDPALARKGPRVAEQLVKSALSELEQIEKLDEVLAPDDASAFDREAVVLLTSMYSEWACQAEALLGRAAEVEAAVGRVVAFDALRDAHGRIRAMLSIPVDHIEEARRQLSAGRLRPAEEVRRELRLGVH
jgi:hypothetical protein